MNDLYRYSIELILENQSETGAYPASPSFQTYMYSWFRDGTYIAYAMDRVGKHESSSRFHTWTAEVINRHEAIIQSAIKKVASGDDLNERDVLHTRYTLEGKNSEEDWPNFQLDGFGTWLWGLAEHLLLSGLEISQVQQRAVHLLAEYLAALWKVPCFDCWEEFPERIHPYTLAAIYGGLEAAKGYLKTDYGEIQNKIRDYILEHHFHGDHFVKLNGAPTVDANLVGLAIPYKVFSPKDERIRKTITCIKTTLRVKNGGVHRYPTDTYYGGGEWVVLAGWLGWYYAEVGDQSKAMELLTWIEAQADVKGNLPEQVPNNLNNDSFYEPWRKRWGDIAQPLLWSHANYLILCKALGLRS